EGFRDWEPPEVRLEAVEPKDGVIRGPDVELRVSIKPRGTRTFQAPRRLLVWVNDYQAEEIPVAAAWLKGDTYIHTLRVDAGKFRAGRNVIAAQCYSGEGLRGEAVSLKLRAPAPQGPPALYGLLVGVGDYRRAQPPQRNLKANLDAEVLREAWQGQEGKLFK